MIFSPRITSKQISQLCRRFATSVDAGLDIRTITKREAMSGSNTYRSHMARIHKAVSKGESLATAIKREGEYFPQQFGQMVEVGERTGRLDFTLRKVGEYYERLAGLKGMFLLSIIWPGIQLMVALGVVGLLIWISEFLANSPSDAIDLLGFGLMGTDGLVTYLFILGLIAIGLVTLVALMRRGFLLKPITDYAMRVPALGPALRTMAQLRYARTLGLCIDAGIDAWNSVDLAFRSTQLPYYTTHAKSCKQAVRNGDEIYVAMLRTQAFSQPLIDAVQIGEQTGQLSESLETQANELDRQVTVAFRTLTFAAAGVVWVLVAGFIIFLIFRLASIYLGQINQLLDEI